MSGPKKRFSKTTWLEKSLEILSKEGEKKLTVEHLVKEMGVTRGSFYWHFKSRADYIQCLSEYWAEEYSAKAMRLANSEKPDAKERLLFLFQHLTEFDIARYDAAVLSWSQHEPIAKQCVQRALDARIEFLRTIFSAMGFTGAELEMRIQTTFTFHTMELNGYNHLSKADRMRLVASRHKMLTRK